MDLLAALDASGDESSALKILSKTEFTKYLQNESLTTLMKNKLVPIDWDIGSYETDEDIAYITNKNQTVMTDTELSSLSLLTHPYRVPGGWRLCLDYFGTDPKLMETHLIQQFRKLKHLQCICHSEVLHIFVNFEPELKLIFNQIMQKLKLEMFRKSEFQGKKLEMSFFEKRIR